jgi:hypothetical protein
VQEAKERRARGKEQEAVTFKMQLHHLAITPSHTPIPIFKMHAIFNKPQRWTLEKEVNRHVNFFVGGKNSICFF